jgi:membrane protease YdiL (CAAX protease family)
MSGISPPLAPPPAGPPLASPPPAGAAGGAAAWPPWTAPAALLAGLAGTLLGGFFIGLIAVAAGADLHHPPAGVDLASTVVQDLALVGAAVLFAARGTRRAQPVDFGLRPTRVGPAIGWMVATLVASLVFTAAWAALLNIHQKEHLLHDLGADRGTAAMLAAAALVTVLAPVCEELFFRGYFFTALRNWRGTRPAALVTGLTFGAVHAGSAPAVYLVPLAFLGVVLCLLYARTGSLYPCIALHVINNALAFGVTEHWGWQIPVLMVVALGTVALGGAALTRTRPSAAPA